MHISIHNLWIELGTSLCKPLSTRGQREGCSPAAGEWPVYDATQIRGRRVDNLGISCGQSERAGGQRYRLWMNEPLRPELCTTREGQLNRPDQHGRPLSTASTTPTTMTGYISLREFG
jgi:hypothetical protein